MSAYLYEALQLNQVTAEGVENMFGVNVIGPDQGWDSHTLRIFRLGPGGYSPHHKHDWEHVNCVIKGQGRLYIGQEVFELNERDFAFIPANAMHQFENTSNEDFEFVCIVPSRQADTR